MSEKQPPTVQMSEMHFKVICFSMLKMFYSSASFKHKPFEVDFPEKSKQWRYQNITSAFVYFSLLTLQY